MKTSALGTAFISRNEWVPKSPRCGWDPVKQIYFPYKDYKGFWTWGLGHLIRAHEDFSAGGTEERVMQVFAADLIPVERAIDANVKVPLEQWEWDALVDFGFNEGPGALNTERNTAIRMLNLGRKDLVPSLLLPWDVTAGVHDAGLRNRRIAEGHLWVTPYPDDHHENEQAREDYLAPLIDLMPLAREADDAAREDARDTIPAPAPLADEPTSPQTPVSKSTPPSA